MDNSQEHQEHHIPPICTISETELAKEIQVGLEVEVRTEPNLKTPTLVTVHCIDDFRDDSGSAETEKTQSKHDEQKKRKLKKKKHGTSKKEKNQHRDANNHKGN